MELNREQVEALQEKARRDDWHLTLVGSDIRMLCGMALRSLSVPGWVAVDTGLPDLTRFDDSVLMVGKVALRPIWWTDEVLVMTKSGMHLGAMVARGDKSDPQWYAVSNVTHWQPLPAAPKP